VLAGRLPTPGSPVLGNAIEMLAGGAVLVVFAVVAGESPPAYPSAESLLAVAYLIGPGPLLAMTRYMIAPRRLPTGVVSTYAYVNPFVAVAFGALLLGERFTLSTVIGGAIVVASVALLLLSQRPREFTD
jgi:drug/metabolite transporter (DMT)-like permease